MIENILVKPIRVQYNQSDVNNHIKTNNVHIFDFHVLNQKNQKIVCTLIESIQFSSNTCVLYLHTHNGSKLQGISLYKKAIELGLCLCLFDFSSYGNSEGQYATLGYKEHQDINYVLEYLTIYGRKKKFILWGRSMGASAGKFEQIAALFNSKNKKYQIIFTVYDSPFASLQQLIFQMAQRKTLIPEFVIRIILFFLKKSLVEKGMVIQQLDILSVIGNCNTPALFLLSLNDQVLGNNHVQNLYRAHSNEPKWMFHIKQRHSENRREQTIDKVFLYINPFTKNNNFYNIINNNVQIQKKSKSLTEQ